MAAARLVPSWRLLLAFLEFLATVVLYMNRVNISFAIVCMTRPSSQSVQNGFNGNDTNQDPQNESLVLYSNVTSLLVGKPEFEWDRKLVGFIISSFYIGYLLTQLPAGWLATRISAKWVLVAGMVVTFLTSFLSPVAARGGWGYLVAMQIIKGLACGFFYPSLQIMISSWAPPDERSRLFAIAYSGAPLGSIIGFMSAGFLCAGSFAGGWPAIFYIYGIVGCVWLVLFILLVHDNPADHPFVDKKERAYIHDCLSEEMAFDKKDKVAKVPWRSIFTSLPLLAIVTAEVAYCWLWYTALSCLPLYINDVLNFNVKQNGLASSMPYMVNIFVAFSSSYVADLLIRRNVFRITIVRKIMVSCAMLLPAIFIISVGFLQPHQYQVAVALISIAVGCLAFARPGHHVNTVEIAPRLSSIIMGIDNTICTVTGVLAPIITGLLAPNGTQEEWRRVFFLSGGLSLLGEIVYLIFGSADVQTWALPKNRNVDETVEKHQSQPLTTGSEKEDKNPIADKAVDV